MEIILPGEKIRHEDQMILLYLIYVTRRNVVKNVIKGLPTTMSQCQSAFLSLRFQV